MLQIVANRLGDDLCKELVFVGGSVAGMLISDPAQPAIRHTEDVDLIAHVLARQNYYDLEAALRSRGFQQDMRQAAPICRWIIAGVTVEVMPTLPDVLGFSNIWYEWAVQSAIKTVLPDGLSILVICAPAFIATKFEAFKGRGGGDYLFSHDLGDIITVIDGRDELPAEIQESPVALQRYLGQQASALLGSRSFRDALPGHLPTDAASQARLPDIEAKLQRIIRTGAVPRP